MGPASLAPVEVSGGRSKRLKHPGFLVTAEPGQESEELNLGVILGEYLHLGRESAGQPVFERRGSQSGIGSRDAARHILLYYWGAEDGEELEGWWFGEAVGGSLVYLWAKKKGFPPPVTGWCIPPGGGGQPVGCLRVRVLSGGAAGEGPDASPAAQAPAAPPTPRGPAVNGAGVQAPLRPGLLAAAAQAPVQRPPLWQPYVGTLQAVQAHLPRPASQPKLIRPRAPGVSQPATPQVAATPGTGGGAQSSSAKIGPSLSQRENRRRIGILKDDQEGTLGVKFADLKTQGCPPVVKDVRPGSLAERHGLTPGCQLLVVNGKALSDPETVQWAITQFGLRPLWLEVKFPAGEGPADGPGKPAAGGRPAPGGLPASGASLHDRISALAWELPEDEAPLWERLLLCTRAEKERGGTRSIWNRIRAVALAAEADRKAHEDHWWP